ncbi:MAG TPA: hypothetical protein DC047_02505 [Blastocatellia bacterium]|nr:hypothetical protein [Blastocatellia bacterium]
MKVILNITLLLLVVLAAEIPGAAQGDSNLSVLKFGWSHFHAALIEEPEWNAPPDYRQRTDREKAIAQIQYGDIIKSQELKKAERDAARSAVKTSRIFIYKVKLQNTNSKTIKNFYWEYQVIESANPQNLSARQFFCASQIKADQQRSFEVFSLTPPTTSVINTATLGNESKNAFAEKAVINRIEFKDGSVWQRPDWSFPSPLAEALSTRKLELGEPPCRNF